MLSKNKGITLIALVITIIVLIILAGVSFNLLLGSNGIITKARDGKTNYELAANEEKVALENANNSIDELTNGGSQKGVVLDLGGGVSPEGKTQYVMPLPYEPMSMMDFSDLLMTNENYQIYMAAISESCKNGYSQGAFVDGSTGLPIDENFMLTNSSRLLVTWQEQADPMYTAMCVDFNGKEIELNSASGKQNKAYFYLPIYSSSTFENNFINSISEDADYKYSGLYYDRECTRPFPTAEEVNNMTNEQKKQLGNITAYVKWTKKGEKEIRLRGLDLTVENATKQDIGTVILKESDTYETFRQKLINQASTVVNYSIVGFNFGPGNEDGYTPWNEQQYNNVSFDDFPETIYCCYQDTPIQIFS